MRVTVSCCWLRLRLAVVFEQSSAGAVRSDSHLSCWPCKLFHDCCCLLLALLCYSGLAVVVLACQYGYESLALPTSLHKYSCLLACLAVVACDCFMWVVPSLSVSTGHRRHLPAAKCKKSIGWVRERAVSVAALDFVVAGDLQSPVSRLRVIQYRQPTTRWSATRVYVVPSALKVTAPL